MKIPKYLAFDPGGMTGFAYFDDAGHIITHGQYPFEQFLDTLVIISQAPHLNEMVIIVEDFKLLNHKASAVARNIYSRSLEASQVIGALKYFTKLHKIQLIIQSPEKNSVASGWTGLDANVNHSKSNWKSAVNHGIYYLVMNKFIRLEDVANATTQA